MQSLSLPLFDLEKLSNYADDNYFVKWNAKLAALISDMKKTTRIYHKMVERIRVEGQGKED